MSDGAVCAWLMRVDELLAGATRDHRDVIRHLEGCRTCRNHFRRNADHFPHFPNYTIVAHLGRGGFGDVYRAIHHTKGRSEALKVLYDDTRLKTAFFHNEVHAVARLAHPGITRLYEAHLRRKPLYFTMEYVEGRRLGVYLADEHPTLRERLALFQRIVDAVDYAHREGVVHRDLKPANILVGDDGAPYILDFGIAAWVRRETAEDERNGSRVRDMGPVGTYGFIAPEQAQQTSVDPRADIFALGVLLFTMVTDGHPRDARKQNVVLRALRSRGVDRAADLAAIISRCTNPDPEQRYASCAALADDVERFVNIRAVTARRDVSPFYLVTRAAGYALRHSPLAVYTFIVLVTAGVAAAGLHRVALDRAVTPSFSTPAALVVIDDAAQLDLAMGELGAELPGLDAADPRTWRLYHAQLFAALQDANPTVVLWDAYLPECRPDVDPPLIAALEGQSAPVVVGCATLDANGEAVICPAVREAADGVGLLMGVRPRHTANEFDALMGVKRGFNPWLPGAPLIAAALAAHPDAEPVVAVDGGYAEIRFRRQQTPVGASRWLDDTRRLALWAVVSADQVANQTSGRLAANDQVAIARSATPLRDPNRLRLSYQDVMNATPTQRDAWLTGRPVVVGQWSAFRDVYYVSGELVRGVEVIASTLDMLNRTAYLQRYTRLELVLRCVAYAAAAAALSVLLRDRVPGWRRLTLTATIAFAAGVALLIIAVIGARLPWLVELTVALGVLFLASGPLLLLTASRRLQEQLMPRSTGGVDVETRLATLVLKTRDLAADEVGVSAQQARLESPATQARKEADVEQP